eukprot:3658743-Prymnesium_polylepis.1
MKALDASCHLPHQRHFECKWVPNGKRRSVSDVTNVLNRGSTWRTVYPPGRLAEKPQLNARR